MERATYTVVVTCPKLYEQLKTSELNCISVEEYMAVTETVDETVESSEFGEATEALQNARSKGDIYYLKTDSAEMLEAPEKTGRIVKGVIELGGFDTLFLDNFASTARLYRQVKVGLPVYTVDPPLFRKKDMSRTTKGSKQPVTEHRQIKKKKKDNSSSEDNDDDKKGSFSVGVGIAGALALALGLGVVAYAASGNRKDKK